MGQIPEHVHNNLGIDHIKVKLVTQDGQKDSQTLALHNSPFSTESTESRGSIGPGKGKQKMFACERQYSKLGTTVVRHTYLSRGRALL